MREQRSLRLRREHHRRLAVLQAVLLEKKSRQWNNVFLPFAKGRQIHRSDHQSVIEIFAKNVIFNVLFKVAVGGGDDPNIELGGRRAAKFFDLAVLEKVHQLDLQHRRQFADFVEEKRAPLGRLKLAELRRMRFGERSFFVAKQLAFQETVGSRAAVDDDEGSVSARTVPVNRVGDNFFARAALAGDQHGNVGYGDALNEAKDLAHLRRLPDDAVKRGSGVAIGVLQPALQAVNMQGSAQHHL